MRWCQHELEGVFIIEMEPVRDKRGYFARTFDREEFRRKTGGFEWLQENQSGSLCKGTIRGLHFQFPPFSETKLVRCLHGAVLDVFVDLRKGSPAFGKFGKVELSPEKMNAVLIPKGFAHGFCSLEDQSEVLYKVDSVFAPEHEGGILWKDPDLKIDWPCNQPVLSEKDAALPFLADFVRSYGGLEVQSEI